MRGILIKRLLFPLGESRFEELKLESFRPILLIGSSHDFEDLENLVYLRVPGKKWFLLSHLCHDAADRPLVQGGRVLLLPKEDLRRSVPKSDHLMCIGLDWQRERSSEAKIRKFDNPILADQQILRLEVSMHDPVGVTVSQALQDLIREALHLINGQSCSSIVLDPLLHVLLYVVIKVLKNNVQLFIFVNDLFDLNNVRVLQGLQ